MAEFPVQNVASFLNRRASVRRWPISFHPAELLDGALVLKTNRGDIVMGPPPVVDPPGDGGIGTARWLEEGVEKFLKENSIPFGTAIGTFTRPENAHA